MCRSFSLATFHTLIYFAVFLLANGNRACLRKHSGIYLTRDENRVFQLTWYSPDGTLINIDSNQKSGSPTNKGRNDRIGRWKCDASKEHDILTQSIQVLESPRSNDSLVTRLYETAATCPNNKRTNCSNIIQYRGLNITITTNPPDQTYSFSENFHSLDGQSLFLHYTYYKNQAKQHPKCLREKSGLYVIEYEKESDDGGIKKTYGLFQLKDDGFFSLVNSDESVNGTHKYGTTLGRWECTGDHLSATGLHFIYHPQRKFGAVRLRINNCSPSLTLACSGDVVSREYPLQLRRRPFRHGSNKTRQNITIIKYLNGPQTKNKRCYKDFAGTYFALLGGSNNTNQAVVLSGVYRTAQSFRDGRAYDAQVSEILVDRAVGNAIGYWRCNGINSNTTRMTRERIVFSYNTIGGPIIATASLEYTCNNALKTCLGEGTGRDYYGQLPYNGQLQQPVTTVIVKPVAAFYAFLPPY